MPISSIAEDPCITAATLKATDVQPCNKINARWILAATILGSGMAFVDSTIVNVALPALQLALDATATELQWFVEAYALLLAALLIVGGRLGDRYGRRRIYALGIIIFTIASLFCGLSQSPAMLIAARALQGIGGALLVPGSLAIISASFSREQRGRAIGIWSGFTAITTGLGLLLGGWLVDYVSWRAIFFINIPIAAVTLLLTYRYAQESRDKNLADSKLDWPGALTITVALSCLTYGLIESANLGFAHVQIQGAYITGLAALAVFFFIEKNAPAPMIDFSVFHSKNFSATNVLTFFLYFAIGGSLYFLPLNLIQVQGYSALAAGAANLPFIILMFLLSAWSGGLVHRYGARKPLVIGPLIIAMGLVMLAFPEINDNYWTTFFPGIVTIGFGLAISVAPLTTTVMSSVQDKHAGLASGINNAVSRTAGLLAIAVMGPLMIMIFNNFLLANITTLDIPAETIQLALNEISTKMTGSKLAETISQDVVVQLREITAQSFVQGFRIIIIASALCALTASLIAWKFVDRKTNPVSS